MCTGHGDFLTNLLWMDDSVICFESTIKSFKSCSCPIPPPLWFYALYWVSRLNNLGGPAYVVCPQAGHTSCLSQKNTEREQNQ